MRLSILGCYLEQTDSSNFSLTGFIMPRVYDNRRHSKNMYIIFTPVEISTMGIVTLRIYQETAEWSYVFCIYNTLPQVNKRKKRKSIKT